MISEGHFAQVHEDKIVQDLEMKPISLIIEYQSIWKSVYKDLYLPE